MLSVLDCGLTGRRFASGKTPHSSPHSFTVLWLLVLSLIFVNIFFSPALLYQHAGVISWGVKLCIYQICIPVGLCIFERMAAVPCLLDRKFWAYFGEYIDYKGADLYMIFISCSIMLVRESVNPRNPRSCYCK